MFHSESINELSSALSKAQSKIGRAEKGSTNPAFKSRYADLASVMDACILALNSEGLSITQILTHIDGKPVLLTRLMHTSGQYIDSYCPLYIDTAMRNPMHGLGSALTYARRYSLAAICGVSQEDDDGNACQKRSDVVRQIHDKTVTSDQAKKLMGLLGKCNEDFCKNVWDYATKQFKIKNWFELPEKVYERFIDRITMQIESYETKTNPSNLTDPYANGGFFDDVIALEKEGNYAN